MNESDEELQEAKSDDDEIPKQTSSYTAYIKNLKHFVSR